MFILYVFYKVLERFAPKDAVFTLLLNMAHALLDECSFPKQLELLGVLTSEKKRIRSNPRGRGVSASHFGSLSRMFIFVLKHQFLQCFGTTGLETYVIYIGL